MSELSEADLLTAFELERQLILRDCGIHIFNIVQRTITKELLERGNAPHPIDPFAYAVVLLAAGRGAELAQHKLEPTAQHTIWVPRARELLFTYARELQEKRFKEAL